MCGGGGGLDIREKMLHNRLASAIGTLCSLCRRCYLLKAGGGGERNHLMQTRNEPLGEIKEEEEGKWSFRREERKKATAWFYLRRGAAGRMQMLWPLSLFFRPPRRQRHKATAAGKRRKRENGLAGWLRVSS